MRAVAPMTRISATEEMEIFLTGLPPVEMPAVEQDNFEVVETLGGSAQFEDPKEQLAGVQAAGLGR